MIALRQALLALVVSVAILATGLVVAEGYDDPAITRLSPENFKKEVLRAKGPVLVVFEAPWCGHCKRLAPAYAEAAKALDGVVKLAAMDADKHGGFASKYGVQGFPTIKWFGADKKKPIDYEGGRTKEDIVADALKKVEEVANARMK